jgi:hypothetical protein
MKGRSLSGYQRKRLWLNDGLGRSPTWRRSSARAIPTMAVPWRSPISATAGARRHRRESEGPLLIYKNTVAPGRHWIQFELEGSHTNRSAIGAQVELHWKNRKQVQQVTTASGFSAQNQRRLHYGLGDADAVDRVVIRWPSGREQTIDRPQVDMLHHVKEPDSAQGKPLRLRSGQADGV